MYNPCDDIGPDGLHHCPYGAIYASECRYYCPSYMDEDEDYPDLEDEDDEEDEDD